jgi:hypothetical protein
LDDAAAKIAEYYDKTAASDAFLLSMGMINPDIHYKS